MRAERPSTRRHYAIANLRADLGVQWPIELVTLGPGITACLSASPAADQLQELIRQGVTVVACANSLTGRNLSRSRPNWQQVLVWSPQESVSSSDAKRRGGPT